MHALVRNRFFRDSQLDLLLDIMESNKLYFSIHLIYDLVMNGKITPAIKDLLIQFTQNPLSDEYLVKIGIAVYKSKAKYP